MREREGKRERGREGERERGKEGERARERGREGKRGREREREREGEGESDSLSTPEGSPPLSLVTLWNGEAYLLVSLLHWQLPFLFFLFIENISLLLSCIACCFPGFGVGAAQLLLLALIPPPSRQGFFALCSSNSSGWRRSSCGKGAFGGPTALIRKTEEYAWGGNDNYFTERMSASHPVLKASVCANAPSLPTHDELLKQCGLDEDPEIAYGFPDDDSLH